ncbi:MAG TPA: hypothetical protein VF610_10710 [Segetibacter sp.]|jgi:hypothetical protein
MEESFNTEKNTTETTKTSSTDGSNSKTTGDSQVQDGKGVETNHEKSYEKSDEQQEYVEDANNNTKVANNSVVQNGKTLSM